MNLGQTGGLWEPFDAKELQAWEECEEMSLTENHKRVFDRNIQALNTTPSLFQTGETEGLLQNVSNYKGC